MKCNNLMVHAFVLYVSYSIDVDNCAHLFHYTDTDTYVDSNIYVTVAIAVSL